MTIGSDTFPIDAKINGSDITFEAIQSLNPGWNYIDGHWYYADDLCNMYRNQWYFSGYNWYYFGDDGKMCSNDIIEIDGDDYIFNQDGELITGWMYVPLRNSWLYFNPNTDGSKGAMVKSKWIFSEGKWYYLTATGAMAKNTTINGYYFDNSGAWVK